MAQTNAETRPDVGSDTGPDTRPDVGPDVGPDDGGGNYSGVGKAHFLISCRYQPMKSRVAVSMVE